MKWITLTILLGLMATGARAQAPELYQTIRALQELQTGIAMGKARAREEQEQVVADIGRQMALADPQSWSEPRQARAAIIWLLSGGSPHVMRRAMLAGTWPDHEGQIARGALAFVEGRAAQARELLLPLDARVLDPALGGQIALVQAALILPESHEKAIGFLALARLLAPGTLVEETALRRQISLAGDISDAENFAALSRQYSRRFSRSLYASDFRHAFAETFTRIGISVAGEQVEQLAPILDAFDAEERCRLAVLIARASLIEGAWRSAVAFAGRVMKLPLVESCDVPRGRLYRAAARIASADHEVELMALDKLDPARLGAEDQALRKASLYYARLVTSWPAPTPPTSDEAIAGDEALAAAKKALDDSASLLKGARR